MKLLSSRYQTFASEKEDWLKREQSLRNELDTLREKVNQTRHIE